MRQTRSIEIGVGLFMAAGLVALFFLAMQVSNLGSLSDDDGYVITARFYNIGGLKVKAPVTMAGVTLGRVVDISFDQQTYEAVVSMRIDPKYTNIPDDSFAKVYTAGLLGEKYIGLDPGGDYVAREFHAGHHIWFCSPDGRDPRGPHGNYPSPHSTMLPPNGKRRPYRDGRILHLFE